jgi:hypothetical protein
MSSGRASRPRSRNVTCARKYSALRIAMKAYICTTVNVAARTNATNAAAYNGCSRRKSRLGAQTDSPRRNTAARTTEIAALVVNTALTSRGPRSPASGRKRISPRPRPRWENMASRLRADNAAEPSPTSSVLYRRATSAQKAKPDTAVRPALAHR